MTTPTQYFIVNKLNSILSTRDGTLDIPAFGYAKIREQDLENLTILYATERDWAEITNTEPKGKKQAVVEEIKIEITEPFKGLTLEELQEEQAAKAAAAEQKALDEADAVEETPAPKTKKGK